MFGSVMVEDDVYAGRSNWVVDIFLFLGQRRTCVILKDRSAVSNFSQRLETAKSDISIIENKLTLP